MRRDQTCTLAIIHLRVWRLESFNVVCGVGGEKNDYGKHLWHGDDDFPFELVHLHLMLLSEKKYLKYKCAEVVEIKA